MDVFDSKPQIFRRKVREGLGKVFGKIGLWLRLAGRRLRAWWSVPKGRTALISGVILVTAAVLALAVFRPQPTAKNDIIIGDITITQDDISRHAEALRSHMTLNPGIVVDDPEQTALDDLVMNAALKHYNNTRCHAEVSPSDVLRAFGRPVADDAEAESIIDDMLGRPGEFMRVRMENVVYQEAMDGCMIDRRSILFVGAQIYTHYFAQMSEQAAAEAFEGVRRRLQEEFTPMVEGGWPASEIARRADIDLVNDDVDNSSDWRLLGTTPAIVAGIAPCTGVLNNLKRQDNKSLIFETP
jgi:hypothetical protein